MAAIAACLLTSIQCTEKEQKRSGDAINDAADAAKGVLRDVAEGVNNAVY